VEFPEDLKYTEDHEWVRIDGNICTVGITDYAQSELTDITFVELPAVDDELTKGESLGTVDGIKAVSDIYSPADGKVTETNEELENHPEFVNEDPYGKGWMVKFELTDPSQLDELMDATAYEKLVEEA